MKQTAVIDYMKMELGRVTRTFKGRNVAVIARCPKCGKRGERSVSIPDEKGEALRGRKPYVMVSHIARDMRMPTGLSSIGFAGFREIRESCNVQVDQTNVDELLSVAERKRYDAFVAERSSSTLV